MGVRNLPHPGGQTRSAWFARGQPEHVARRGRSDLLLPSRHAKLGRGGVAPFPGIRESKISGRRNRTLVPRNRFHCPALLTHFLGVVGPPRGSHRFLL